MYVEFVSFGYESTSDKDLLPRFLGTHSISSDVLGSRSRKCSVRLWLLHLPLRDTSFPLLFLRIRFRSMGDLWRHSQPRQSFFWIIPLRWIHRRCRFGIKGLGHRRLVLGERLRHFRSQHESSWILGIELISVLFPPPHKKPGYGTDRIDTILPSQSWKFNFI